MESYLPNPGGATEENFGIITDADKNGVYYFIVLFFVLSAIVSTLLSTTFLILSILLWGHFKPLKFFWFLTQLTIFSCFISTFNLLINVPAALSLISPDVAQSELFIIISIMIDYCHYAILFSNVVIAIQRGFVFFLRHYADRVFDSPFIFIWLLSTWVFSFAVEYSLISSNCLYRYKNEVKHIVLNCGRKVISDSLILYSPPPAFIEMMETVIQIAVPIFILGIYIAIIIKISSIKRSSLSKQELGILKQAIFVFLFFQSSSLIFLCSRAFTISNVTAFLVKRFVNTMEILGGAATPCFFFFTSKKIRKLISARVSAASSQGGSNIQVRRSTMD